jgi:expansin (peptidoglycan-binding protein)
MRAVASILLLAACGGGDGGDPGDPNPDELVTYGAAHTGGEFHLGPVDWAETAWHNACAPGGGYQGTIRAAEGAYLAGVWSGITDVASIGDACDTCIYVTTAAGKSALLRVVTYGDTTPNSIDVSPEAYAILDSGEYPRAMTWQFAKCNDTGPLYFEFQTGSNPYWTSLWVRNARVPLAKVEVTRANHAAALALARAGDGALTDASGFGEGGFTLTMTGVDGQVVTDTIAWPSGGIGGAFITGQGNFR